MRSGSVEQFWRYGPKVSWNPGGGPTCAIKYILFANHHLDPIPKGKEFSPIFVCQNDFQVVRAFGGCGEIMKSIKTKPTLTCEMEFLTPAFEVNFMSTCKGQSPQKKNIYIQALPN